MVRGKPEKAKGASRKDSGAYQGQDWPLRGHLEPAATNPGAAVSPRPMGRRRGAPHGYKCARPEASKAGAQWRRDAQGGRPPRGAGGGGWPQSLGSASFSVQAAHLLPHPGHLAGPRGAARGTREQPAAPAPVGPEE